MELFEKLNLNTGNLLGRTFDRKIYRCQFIKAGKVRAAGGGISDIEVTFEALTSAISKGLFDGKASFMDHAGFFEYPSMHNLVGVTYDTSLDMSNQTVVGYIKLYDTPAADIVDSILSDILNTDIYPDVGLSLVFYPTWERDTEGKRTTRIIDIKHVESVDFVFEPAAEGRVLEALSRQGITSRHGIKSSFYQTQANEKNGGLNQMQEETIFEEQNDQDQVPQQTGINPQNAGMNSTSPQGPSEPTLEGASLASAWMHAMAESAATVMIASSGLPEASKKRLASQTYNNPDAVRNAIAEERAYLAKLQEDQVINIGGDAPRGGNIQVGRSSIEKIELALGALLSGKRPGEGIQPLTGIRELYHLLSGDYEMTGIFQSERIQFANVTSSTMAQMCANALNKVLVNEFMQYPMWWSPFVTEMDFQSLQAVRWITLGGVGELPTVAEGAAYTELTWDDKYETASFVKKGGYLGLTIEAIDKDDTGRLTSAPRALAQAAWLTLGKSVSAIFTDASGTGPTMSDSVVLFHADHANLGTTALSTTEWAVVRTAMRKHAEVNSSERLGALTAPKFILVPPDLEATALKVLASEYDYAYAVANAPAAPSNVLGVESNDFASRLALARERVIVVDLWTDTNNWAAVADPRLYPTIGIGYRYGRNPEVYSVASPTAGLMFTNDTMPIKVRFFFAVGPVDYRGLYKENVA